MKKTLTSILLTIIFFSGFIFSGCSDDSNPTAPAGIPEPDVSNFVFINSGYVTGANASISFYADDSLRTGYNKFYFVLHDSVSGELITDAHITIVPRNHGHASPVENPEEEAPDALFRGAMVFTESFTDIPLHWHILFTVHNHQSQGEPEGEIEFSTPRILDNHEGFKSITMSDSTKLYLSFINPNTPITGLNDFEFLISKNEPELFPPDGSYTIQMNPVFISDGHTTSNNVNPVGSPNGHYRGRVDFDMNGAWRINVKLTKNGIFYNTYFEVNY